MSRGRVAARASGILARPRAAINRSVWRLEERPERRILALAA